MSHEIKDVLPVVHMPYGDDQQIDYATLEREVDYLNIQKLFQNPW